MITDQQISALNRRKEDLFKFLSIEEKQLELQDLEKLTHVADFWNNSDKAQLTLKKISKLKFWVNTYKMVENELDELGVLQEFYNENEASEEDLEKQHQKALASIESLEFKNMLSTQEDELPAVLTINPGAGGTESQDWAEMIMRMYLMWGEKNGYKVKELDLQKAEPAGIKSVTLEFDGDFAFGHLKGENGVHRLVRISPFDSNNRRHTSFASVFVYPTSGEEIQIEIDQNDLRIDTYRASGAGGQHVNKTDSAIRITHIPSGVVVQCQNERSQHKNKASAMKVLKARLYQMEKEKEKEAMKDLEDTKMDISWGSQIRSYVFHPYNLVKDHRTKEEMGNITAVMDG
ncbi:MAG: peptide chain release factor 2, partial [Flavobacteriales bacterium]|nr:peptide chain release factor 2 [Flavobacteriales bacterium]